MKKMASAWFDGRLGLRAHPAGQAFRRRLLESGRVDHGEFYVAEPALAFPAIARDAGPVINQSQTAAHQPVEQGRFADVGSADNGNREVHQLSVPG